jgi:tryptophanase
MNVLLESRWRALVDADFNVWRIPPSEIPLDLATDISSPLARNVSLVASVDSGKVSAIVRRELACGEWLPVHLARGAEAIIASLIRPGNVVLANETYVTAQWSIERAGGQVVNIPSDGHPVFGGNLHIPALAQALRTKQVAYVQISAPATLLTAHGGQPVSLGNMQSVCRIVEQCQPRVPIVLDASRIFENAVRIQGHEAGHNRQTVAELVRQQISYADVVYLSARKDLRQEHGGILTATAPWMDKLREAAYLLAGTPESGGLSAHEIAALAECFPSSKIEIDVSMRVREIERISARLRELGVPVSSYGAGGIFLNAHYWLPRVRSDSFPAQTLVALLYLHGGIRALGTWSNKPEEDQIVRICHQPSASDFVIASLPAIMRATQVKTSGLRLIDRAPAFGDRFQPESWEDWPRLRVQINPPSGAPSLFAAQAAAWAQLEPILRSRLGLRHTNRLIPAAAERGPQRLLVEAAGRCDPPFAISTRNELVRRIAAFYGVSCDVHIGRPLLRICSVAEFPKLERVQGSNNILAVDVGGTADWNASGVRPGELLQSGADIIWSSNAVGSARGGFVAFSAHSSYFCRIRDEMIFSVGSPCDGGLSIGTMLRMVHALKTDHDGDR